MKRYPRNPFDENPFNSEGESEDEDSDISDAELEAFVKESFSSRGDTEKLNLSKQKIGDVYIKFLAPLIEHDSTLKELDLSANKLGFEGVKAVTECLKNHPSVQVLDLGAAFRGVNRMGDCVQHIGQLLKQNNCLTFLNIGGNSIDGYEAVLKDLAEGLGSNTKLIELNVEANAIGSTSAATLAEALTKNRSVKVLRLGHNYLGDEGAKALAPLLKDNDTLSKIDLNGNNIGDAGTNVIAQLLQGNHSLKVMILGHNSIGPAGAEAIAMALELNDTLSDLTISDNQIGPKGVTAIAEALKSNGSLSRLGIGHNGIGNEGAMIIAQVVKDHHPLAGLDIGNNQIDETGAIAIAQMLENNTSMEDLYLTMNPIKSVGAIAIVRALKGNKTLKTLSLINCNIRDDAADTIEELIKNNDTLTVLRLNANAFNFGKRKGIVYALLDNHAITELEIDTRLMDKNTLLLLERFLTRNKRFRHRYEEAIKYLNVARELLKSPELNQAEADSISEAIETAKQISKDLEREEYNRASSLSSEIDILLARVQLHTGNIFECLEIYTHKLQPQPSEELSFELANRIYDDRPLPHNQDNLILILMLLRGTTQGEALQCNVLRELRGIKGIKESQSLIMELSADKEDKVDKIVSVLDELPPNNSGEVEKWIFYEDLALSPKDPPLHNVPPKEIPSKGHLSTKFEKEKTGLLEQAMKYYSQTPSVGMQR